MEKSRSSACCFILAPTRIAFFFSVIFLILSFFWHKKAQTSACVFQMEVGIFLSGNLPKLSTSNRARHGWSGRKKERIDVKGGYFPLLQKTHPSLFWTAKKRAESSPSFLQYVIP